MKFEIDLPLPVNWEFVGYRIPKKGEYYFNPGPVVAVHKPLDNLLLADVNFLSAMLVFKEIKPQWPRWLQAGWVYRDKTGIWWSPDRPYWYVPSETWCHTHKNWLAETEDMAGVIVGPSVSDPSEACWEVTCED
jgi:hypothetical protein